MCLVCAELESKQECDPRCDGRVFVCTCAVSHINLKAGDARGCHLVSIKGKCIND